MKFIDTRLNYTAIHFFCSLIYITPVKPHQLDECITHMAECKHLNSTYTQWRRAGAADCPITRVSVPTKLGKVKIPSGHNFSGYFATNFKTFSKHS